MSTTGRPEQPEPFLRGAPFPSGGGVPYPRAKPEVPMLRLPMDTWTMASVPAGVRLEFSGDAEAVEVDYVTTQAALRVPGRRRGRRVHAVARRRAGRGGSRRRRRGHGPPPGNRRLRAGHRPPPRAHAADGHRHPGRFWCGGIDRARPAAAPLDRLRRLHHRGLDRVDARAIVAARDRADATASTSPTWATPGRPEARSPRRGDRRPRRRRHHHRPRHQLLDPHPVQRRPVPRGARAFLDIVRQGHSDTPIVAVSPITRPDAESTPNRLGAHPHRPASRLRGRRAATASPPATPS